MIRFAIILPAMLLSGCAMFDPPKPESAVTTDTFCLQRERKWGVEDSAETIRDVEVFNETLRRRCSRMKLS